jgi:flavin-dependent dehydrogenase
MSTNGWTVNPDGKTHAAVEHFDVIIVGARCAGSPLATLLARAGLKVVVVEQATFPRATLSSHLMEADGLLFLKRLGVLDAIEETGTRFMKRTDTRLNDYRTVQPFPLQFDDVGGAAFLRRHLLDSILAEAAVEAGADVRMGHKVVEVLWDNKRVCGVRAQHDGTHTRFLAPLVVGADGRSSTLAYMTGSRKYNVNRNARSYYFTFFEGAAQEYADLFVFHRWGDRMVWAGPADNGLYLVGISPEQHERDYFRVNTERGLLAHMRQCEPTAEALADAKIATKISGITKFEGYFRQPTGPGWVLVGDAGHFKDPSAGRGIGDAFLQVEALVPAILTGLDAASATDPAAPIEDAPPAGGALPPVGSAPATDGRFARLDAGLRRWGQWRDRRFEGHYWLANTLGDAGSLPAVVPEAVGELERRGELDRFFDLFSHRSRYYDVFPMADMGAATARLLRSGKVRRGPLVREVVTLLAREPRRRWINRHPALAPTDLTPAPADKVRPVAVPAAAPGPTPDPAPSLAADRKQ